MTIVKNKLFTEYAKSFNIPHNKHLGNSHDYWKAPQKNSKKIILSYAMDKRCYPKQT